MQTNELTINPELRDLLPPLSAEEFAGLETEILRDGCNDELTLWGNVLVDGHHRYEICTKHGLPFKTKQKEFANLDEAKLWAWQHQGNRRNLTAFQRIEIALKLKPGIAEKAKQNQVRKSSHSVCQTSDKQNSIDTKKEVAALAGVSHDSVAKAEYVLEHADEETKEKLRRNEKGTSINKEFNRLKADAKLNESAESKALRKTKADNVATKKAKSKKSTPVKLKSRSKLKNSYCCGVEFEPDPGDTYYDWLTDKERAEFLEIQKNCVNPIFPQIRNITIQNIPEHKPDNLIACLFGLFSPLYREKLAYNLLREMYRIETEKEKAETIVNNLYQEFNR
jgi:hypothetical protein